MTTLTSTAAADRDLKTGMLLMAVAMVTMPGLDAVAKYLTATLSPGQVSWGRFFFQTVIMAPAFVAVVLTQPGWRPRRIWAHAARGLLLSSATLFFFWGISHLPLADATALFFVAPFILTLMSVVFLGETVGWRRVAAIAVGFLGALIIIRPGWAVFGWASLLPFGAAVCYSGYIVMTRRFAAGEGVIEMQFWAGLFGTVNLSIFLLLGWGTGASLFQVTAPTFAEWLMLAACGLIAAVAHFLVVMAVRRAPAGLIAPLQYIEIVSATTLGLLVFGDFPDGWTMVGIAIIVGAGLYVFYRERRHATAPPR